MQIGLISDTHGTVPEAAVDALQGSSRVVHAGDVGDPSVLERLRRIAPVVAVRGNVDTAGWARVLPETEVVDAGGVLLYVLHDLSRLDLEPAAAGFAAVVSGHSHRPSIRREGGVLYLNPGYAGRRRFSLPMSVMLLSIDDSVVRPQLVELPG